MTESIFFTDRVYFSRSTPQGNLCYEIELRGYLIDIANGNIELSPYRYLLDENRNYLVDSGKQSQVSTRHLGQIPPGLIQVCFLVFWNDGTIGTEI